MRKKWIPNYININILKNNILEEAFIKKKGKIKSGVAGPGKLAQLT